MKLNKSKFIITVLILSIFIPAIVSASSGPSLSDILKYKNPSSFESFLSAKKNVDSSIGMANPAAIYCRELGYEYKFVDSSKGKSGVCVFPDETECGQWQFLQGECGQEWSYCAINGYNIITKTDGKNSISKDYAVCVDKDDKEIGSVTELIKLSEKATVGKSYSPIQESDEGGAGPLGPRAPSSFDWRDVSGHNWLTSVQDQGGCGSCWAFSAVGVTEAMYNIRSNNPNLDINLSEQYLVTDCHTSLLYDQSCCGGRKELALMYIRDDGIPDEECMKYVDDHGCTCTEDVPDGPKTCDSNCNYRGYKTPCSDKTCSIDRCLDWESRLTTIDETAYVSNNPDIIKQRLIERGPLAASMGYGDDFGGDWNGDIYECTDDTGTNHGVVIVGYDDVGDYWIIRNSYGPDWEDNGYFKVGYGECSIESSVYYADVETGGGCGTITENTILSGDLHSIGTCITFGADDITLDCANNRIIGNGDGYGIYAKDRSNIKVKNCRIEDFTAGIYLDNVHDSDFGVGSTLRIDDSIGYGIDLRRSSGNRVLNAIISDCHTGIGFYISDDNLISSTDILSSEYFDVSSSSDSDNIIKSSDFDKNKIVFADSDSSLELQWKLSVRVIDSNGQGVGQADVTITNKKGTQVCSDQTNPDGYIPSCLVTEYIHKGDGSKDYYTPHTITAEKGGDYDDRVEYVERDESVVLVFGTPQSSCGNIYDDTILQNDLYYSGSGACIYFEGEGITLNCNEFRIIGPDTEHAVAVELSDGSIGNDNVIKNCKIENFKFGISSSNSNYISGQKIISNEISNCKVPITLRRVEDMDISGNTITNYGENGANIIGISDSRIHHNTISNGNHGMWVENGNNNEFYENEFSYNTATDYSIGLYLFNCGYNDVLNNDFIGNKEGFALNGGSATVAGNLAKDNIYGLHSNNNGGEFYNNKLEGNTEAGIWLTGHNNEVYENEYVPQGRTKYLILLGGGHDNLIRNEILSGSTVYDIYSQWGAFYNELLDSTFNKAKFGYEDVNEELAIEWSSDVRVVDGTGYPLGSAFVTITDDKNNIVFQDYTETNGYIPTQKLIEYIDSKYSEDYRTPHTFEVELSGFECETKELYIDSPQEVTLTCDISLSSPGDLCNVGSECGSSYCEGSVSNPARCCTAAPTSDGWYGGGDDPGCGVDPDSEDTDYYCDATGAEQPEIISTFNCDSQDDCTTHCDGDNVVGDLDYYVILNTNTCDSTGGGIVEDCTTKASTDTDGGNVPLTFGTVSDYTTCSAGACVGSDYDDVCSSPTNLLEYFPTAVSYNTYNYFCSDFEVPATDAYGDDPTYTEACTAGTGAGCSAGQFDTTAGSGGGTDYCQGTCPGPSCIFVEYYPVDSADACPGTDSCATQNYDPDTCENTCNECIDVNYWNLGGDVSNCCEDDNNEYKTARYCNAVCTSNPSDDACCNADDKCAYASTCYNNGVITDPDGDTLDEKCVDGTWEALQAGDLCNIGSECGSSYCEGSVSNPARCCTLDPLADGWYGGGDTPGCGADPDSDYEDSYCDINGNEQYEVTDTKNCDSSDDCTTWCAGNEVHGDLDYYVIEDTDQCTSTGGGLIEDCTATASDDTDGGNVPLTFGTVTDYTACSAGACIGTDYDDACQSTINLLEYFPAAASYSTQNWLCSSFEVAASDSYGNDPTYTESCTAGTGAGCSAGQFDTTPGSGGTDYCQGTCGTGPNSCIFVEYYPVDSADACTGLDTCTSTNYDADTVPNTCSECLGTEHWNLGGDIPNCCGDDNNEYKTARDCAAGACTSDPTDDACCDLNTKCVYDSICYISGYIGDVDEDTVNEECENGIWIEYDNDNDGVPDGSDLCPDTPTGEEVNSDGCSCSQIEIPFRDCPDDQCEGPNWVDYPDDGYDTCVAGEIIEEYSCDATGSEYNEDCAELLIPLPISPDVNGQVVNPEENGRLDVFGDLWFVWDRIPEATKYRISLAYDGDLGDNYEMDPIPEAIMTPIEQPSSGSPRIPIPAKQMDKQLDGDYRWKVASFVDDAWYGNDVWYPFKKEMIPEITTPDAVISQPGDILAWDAVKHDAAADGLGTDGGPEYLIVRLRGITPGTLCEVENNRDLPAMCYVQLPYRTSDNPSGGTNKGNYFEFDQASLDGVLLGTYEWSISLFEGEISDNRQYKLARMKKTNFGPIEMFTRV